MTNEKWILANKLDKIVKDKCKNVPPDIGLELAQCVEECIGQIEPPVSDDFGELKKIISTNTKICLGDHTMEDVKYMVDNRHHIAMWAETLDEINRWVKSQNSR